LTQGDGRDRSENSANVSGKAPSKGLLPGIPEAMAKVLSTAFLVFYTTFTVVVSVEHTAASAASFARDSASSCKSIHCASPRSSFARIQEEPFVGIRIVTAFAAGESGSTAPRVELSDIAEDCRLFTPCRAPPELL
jgi:hypothetical protein